MLHEVPMFKKLSINIGDRQKNRTIGPSVINIKAKEKLIYKILKDMIGAVLALTSVFLVNA